MKPKTGIDTIIELLREIHAGVQLNNDLLQQLLNNKKTNSDKNLDAIISVFTSNPMFAKLGITKDVLEQAMKGNK